MKFLAGVVASLLLCAGSAFAAPGDLDPGFGKGGLVQVAPSAGIEPNGALLQPDGKIVVFGELRNTPFATMAMALMRFNADGSPDTHFGRRGRAVAAVTNFINYANAAVLQADGRILVAGEAQSADGTLSEFALLRFNADGTLDASFGSGGKVTTNFVGQRPGGVSNPAHAVVVQADGRILVGGSASACADDCGPRLTALARYQPDGSLDASFGSGGMVQVNAIGNVYLFGLAADGRIAALAGAQAAVFSASGVLQPLGTAVPPPAIASTASQQVQPARFLLDGRYVVAQGAIDVSRHDTDVQLVRYAPNGGIDPTFSNAPFDFDEPEAITTDVAQAIALHANGQAVVGGMHQHTGTGAAGFVLARVNDDGTMDTGFGHGGTLATSFPAFPAGAFVTAVLVQPDHRIVAVGLALTHQANSVGMVLARYMGR